jgi:hypothetical protein
MSCRQRRGLESKEGKVMGTGLRGECSRGEVSIRIAYGETCLERNVGIRDKFSIEQFYGINVRKR